MLYRNLDQIRQKEANALPVAMEQVGTPFQWCRRCILLTLEGQELGHDVLVDENVGRKEEYVAEAGGRAESHELWDGGIPCLEELGADAADGGGGGRG